MVEDGRLGGTRGPRIVVDGHRVQQLGPHIRCELGRPLLEEAQAEMDVAEQAPLLGRQKQGAERELADPAQVVQDRRRDEEVASQPPMDARGLAGKRGDRDRVLEQSPCVAVMAVRGRGQRSQPSADVRVAEDAAEQGGQARMRDLGREELEKPVELVEVATCRRNERARIDIRLLERADVELEPVAEALDPPEDPDGVPFREAGIEQLDVAPDPRVDSPARIDELEREVGRAGFRRNRCLRATAKTCSTTRSSSSSAIGTGTLTAEV